MSRAVQRPRQANRPANRRTLLIYATLAVLAVAAIVAVALANRVPKSAQTVNPNSKIKVGDSAPNFTVSTTAGPFELTKVPTPVVLEVFATWCPHCQREVPVINQLAKQYAGKVAFVGVAGSPYGIDGSSPENQADVMQFVQKLNVTYPVAYDPELKVANAYLQGGYPTLVLIDGNKKVRFVRDGEVPETELRQAIDSVLSSPS